MIRADQIPGTVPPELLRSTPREVVLSAGGKTLVVLALVLLIGGIAGGVWLYTLAAEAMAQADRRAREGVAATAEIVSIRRTRGDNPRAILGYRFEVEGREYHGYGSMRARAARDLKEGSTVQVAYIASQPAENWLAGHAPEGVPLPVVPLLPLATSAAAALIGWSIRRQRQLLEDGRPALARVISKKRMVKGQHSSQRVEVEFTDLGGSHRTARFDVTSKPPEPGAVVTILYDREQPRRVARYPMSLVRVSLPF